MLGNPRETWIPDSMSVDSGIQESLEFRIPCLWIPDATSMDSGFHIQQPGFWITIMVGFRIPLTGFRIPKPWMPDHYHLVIFLII